jgi:hypothetical protein
MPMTALPTPPSSLRPTTFNADMDAFLAALPLFVSQANALGTPGLGGGVLTAALEYAPDITIASVAGTADIGAAAGNDIIFTGSLAVTGLGATATKAKRRMLCTGSPTFANNAAIITGVGRTIQAAPGDIFDWYRDASGVWRLEDCQLFGGTMEASVTSNGMTGGAVATLCSFTVTPGRWKLAGVAQENGSGAGANFYFTAGISGTTASFSGCVNGKSKLVSPNYISGTSPLGSATFAGFDVTNAANTGYFLVAQPLTNSDSFDGSLRADRIL